MADPLILDKHETCGTCAWAVMNPQQIGMFVCHGAPPTPAVLGVTQDALGRPQVQIECLRPNVLVATRACSVHKPKIALVM